MKLIHMMPVVLNKQTLIAIIATHLQNMSAIAISDDVTNIQFNDWDRLNNEDLLSMRVYIKK